MLGVSNFPSQTSLSAMVSPSVRNIPFSGMSFFIPFSVIVSFMLYPLSERPALVGCDFLLGVGELREVCRAERQLLGCRDCLKAVDYHHQAVMSEKRAGRKVERRLEVRVAGYVCQFYALSERVRYKPGGVLSEAFWQVQIYQIMTCVEAAADVRRDASEAFWQCQRRQLVACIEAVAYVRRILSKTRRQRQRAQVYA